MCFKKTSVDILDLFAHQENITNAKSNAIKIGRPQTTTYAAILSFLKFQSKAGVSFIRGNGPSGIGKSRNLHNGPHPCFASNTNNRLGGTTFFT